MRQLIWEIVSLSVGAIWRWNWISAQAKFGYALSVGTVSNRLTQFALLHHNHRHLWIIEWMVQTYILIYTGIGWKIGQEVNPVTEFELLMCRLQHRFVRRQTQGVTERLQPICRTELSSFPPVKKSTGPVIKIPIWKKVPKFPTGTIFQDRTVI